MKTPITTYVGLRGVGRGLCDEIQLVFGLFLHEKLLGVVRVVSRASQDHIRHFTSLRPEIKLLYLCAFGIFHYFV